MSSITRASREMSREIVASILELWGALWSVPYKFIALIALVFIYGLVLAVLVGVAAVSFFARLRESWRATDA